MKLHFNGSLKRIRDAAAADNTERAGRKKRRTQDGVEYKMNREQMEFILKEGTKVMISE